MIPQYDEASREIESLKNVSIILVMAAAVLEAGSLVSVIGWRVLEYWLPIPVSLISYLTLKFGPLKKRSRKHNAKLT